jgi:hypothetical protein
MKSSTRKKIIITLVILFAATTVLLVRYYLMNQLKSTLHEKLETLNKKTDLNISYDSLYIEWTQNTIIVDKLVINKDAYDTTCLYPEFISVHQVKIKGFHLLKLLFSRELNIDDVILDEPHLVIREQSHLLRDSSVNKSTEFAVIIARLQLLSAHVEYIDSASCQLNGEFFTTLVSTGLNLEVKTGNPFSFSLNTLRLDSIRLRFPTKFYSVTMRQVEFDQQAETLTMDTIKIIPHLSKIDFGRKKGFDIDRIEGVLPFLKFSGLTYQYQDTLALQARTADLQFFLRIFHDKRLPHENIHKPLPIQLLRSLPFGLLIDSLQVTKSFVAYEEIASEAETPGSVYFDNLTASITNISNDRHLTDGETRMKAKADFMGQGSLKIETVFPWKREKNCRMEGSLKNFDFTKVNSMLKPATPIEIESGTLDNLNFTFLYNESQSHGELALMYHDLKVVHYKQPEEAGKGKRKKNPDEEKKDNLKTFIINAFVIRKKMDDSLPEEKRSGTISFSRDKTRSVFNYWWKSLFSGIQSAFHLDKLKSRGEKKSASSD